MEEIATTTAAETSAETTTETNTISENRPGEVSIDLFTKAVDKPFEFATIIPEAYKADESIQNILKTENPTEEFFKSYVNAQKLIGSRLQVPGEGATDADWQKFYRTSGAPEDPAKYEMNAVKLEGPDGELATFIHSNRPKAFMDKIAEAGVKWGLTQRQMQGMLEDHDKALIEFDKQSLTQAQSTTAQQNTDFETMAKGAFGTQWEKSLERGKQFLEANVSQADREDLKGLDNKALILMAKALNNFIPKYTKEDTLNNRHLSTMTPDNAKDEARKLMSHPAFSDVMHPEHEKVVNAWRGAYGLAPLKS